jgi:hypothetical protein
MGFLQGITSSGSRNPPEEGDSTGNYQLIYSDSGRSLKSSGELFTAEDSWFFKLLKSWQMAKDSPGSVTSRQNKSCGQ